MFGLGMSEMLILCLIGLMLFGKGLPGMARSLGKTLVEFRKSYNGVEDEPDLGPRVPQRSTAVQEAPRPPQRIQATTPKFDQ